MRKVNEGERIEKSREDKNKKKREDEIREAKGKETKEGRKSLCLL